MHEMSIAQSVIAIASRHAAARQQDGVMPRVTRVELKVGYLRQVVPTAIHFNFELAAQGTPVVGAELVIEGIPAIGVCRRCRSETRLESFPLQCAACAGFDLEIVAGEELDVEALEIEEVELGYSHQDRGE
jgi:hydrogenase nickel incorporation protein HypA/HybF